MLLVISTVSGPEVTDWFNKFCCEIEPKIYAYVYIKLMEN